MVNPRKIFHWSICLGEHANNFQLFLNFFTGNFILELLWTDDFSGQKMSMHHIDFELKACCKYATKCSDPARVFFLCAVLCNNRLLSASTSGTSPPGTTNLENLCDYVIGTGRRKPWRFQLLKLCSRQIHKIRLPKLWRHWIWKILRMLCFNWVEILIRVKNFLGRPSEKTTIQKQGRIEKKWYRPRDICSIWNKW